MDYTKYKECIDACLKCVSLCNYCASACLKEKEVNNLAACIQLDIECAFISSAAAQLMSLGSSQVMQICMVCADICEACAMECKKHDYDHCKECADACRDCSEKCRQMNNRGD